MRKAGPLKEVSALCLALPDATRQDHPGTGHATFRVRKKVFAYFLDNHHGDGIVSVCVKAPPGEAQAWLALDPKRYYAPAYIGPRGWIGVRLDRGKVAWKGIEKLIAQSYAMAAPKALLARLPANGSARSH